MVFIFYLFFHLFIHFNQGHESFRDRRNGSLMIYYLCHYLVQYAYEQNEELRNILSKVVFILKIVIKNSFLGVLKNSNSM